MESAIPIRWHASNGWIVLSGSADRLSDIRASALSRYHADGAIAYISFLDDLGDALMDDMAELGAPTGYLVDLDETDNNAIYERITGAGMIVIEANQADERLIRQMSGTALHAMKEVLSRGAVILFEGAAAALAGEHVRTTDGNISKGLSLVENVMFAPDVSSIAEDEAARSAHDELPDAIIIGLAPGSALVLGPEQQIETWGKQQVTLFLGNPEQR